MKKIFIFILVSLCALGLQAQNIKVSGTVVSESDNEPLMGAYVKVAGATTGAVTDIDGHYTIEVDKNRVKYLDFVYRILQKGRTRPSK